MTGALRDPIPPGHGEAEPVGAVAGDRPSQPLPPKRWSIVFDDGTGTLVNAATIERALVEAEALRPAGTLVIGAARV